MELKHYISANTPTDVKTFIQSYTDTKDNFHELISIHTNGKIIIHLKAIREALQQDPNGNIVLDEET
jgi:hypothetical protein